MKCISLYQPWASAIAYGWKTIETRTHERFRGLVGERIGIHAGKKWDKHALEIWKKSIGPEQYFRIKEHVISLLQQYHVSHNDREAAELRWGDFESGRWVPKEDSLIFPRGKLICSVEVTHQGWLPEMKEYANAALIELHMKRHGLWLGRPQLIWPPMKMVGRQGIWSFDLQPAQVVV